MMLAAVSAAPMTAQTNVSTEPQLKKALLEEYTGIHCGNCPDGHRYAAKLHLAQPNKFYTMCIHAGHYAEANTALGEPDYTTEMGDALNTEFGVSGYPSGIINRHEFSDYGTVLSRSYWGACAREITSEIAPVNLWIEASYDKNNRTLLVNVEGYLTSDLTGEDVTLTVALAQNYIQGPQSGGLVGNEYMHRHMLRDYITPGLWGEALNVSAKGQYFEKSYTYIVPEAIKEIPVVPTDLEVIAFVTEGKREILNVEDCAVNCEGVTVDIAPEISASKLGTARGYGYNFFEMYVTNRSSEPIETATFDVTFNGETTQVNWDGEIPAHSENVAIQIPVKWDNTQNANKYAVTMTKANNKAVSTATLSGSYDAVLEAPAKMQVEIRTDRFASDDRYLIRDSKGAIVKEFGPYADGTQSVYTEEISLEGNRNYCLEVQDAWADGVMSPRGYVKLYDMDKNLVAQQLEIKDHGCRIFFKTQAPQAENTEWSNEPIDLFPENYLTYSTEMMAGPGGTTWYVVDHPAGADEYDTDNMVYEFRVQAVDKTARSCLARMAC